jgi:hypothetical protein
MSRVSLTQAFPGCELVAEVDRLDDPVMPAWPRLLGSAGAELGMRLAQRLGLRADSAAAGWLEGVERAGVLLPLDERRRSQLAYRSFVVELAAGPRLLFSGISYLLPFDWPPDYREVVSRLGPVCFGPGSELFVDDGSEADELMQRLRDARQPRPTGLVPFFGDGAGGFSCWVDGDASRTFRFDPERSALEAESDGGFAGWFAGRLAEQIEGTEQIERLEQTPQARPGGTAESSATDAHGDGNLGDADRDGDRGGGDRGGGDLEAEVKRGLASDAARHPELQVDDEPS